MKSKKFGDLSRYYWLGGIVIAGLVYAAYSYTNTNNLPANNTVQEEVTNNTVTNETKEEVKETPKPKAPTGPIHIACATNDWDCLAKAAKDKNTATMISFMDDFPYLFTGYMLDISTKLEITDVASNGDVTLREEITNVVVNAIPYTDEELAEMAKNWGIEEEITPAQIEKGRLEADEYWQSRVGKVKISVYTLESFLVFVEQWKNQSWSAEISFDGNTPLGQPYKRIRDDYNDSREPTDWESMFK